MENPRTIIIPNRMLSPGLGRTSASLHTPEAARVLLHLERGDGKQRSPLSPHEFWSTNTSFAKPAARTLVMTTDAVLGDEACTEDVLPPPQSPLEGPQMPHDSAVTSRTIAVRSRVSDDDEEAENVNTASSSTSSVLRVDSKRPWTAEEDARLKALVASEGGRWAVISRELGGGRIGKQCRERWNHHLDPNVNKKKWSAEEVGLACVFYRIVP